MTGGLFLAAYAVLAGFGAPVALRRGWARRVPRVAMTLWLMLAFSWLIAAPMAVISAAVPSAMTWTGPGGQGRAVLTGAPGGMPAAVAGISLAAALAGWTCWHVARGLTAARRGHRTHAVLLAAAGRPDPALGALIVDDDVPAAYCLPSGPHQVVISAGALARLSPRQLRAVLAHERAHLRGHHHLILAAVAALARAFPAVPLLARAAAEFAVLAEISADDAAVRGHDRRDLAAAMVTLARPAAPSTAAPGTTLAGAAVPSTGAASTTLAAGGPDAIARVQRLLAPAPPSALAARAARATTCAAAFLVLAAVILLPLALTACGVISRT